MGMLLLIAAAAMAAPPPVAASFESRAFVRIQRGVKANAEEWERPSPEFNRRERIVKDERGQSQLQRVFEYE